MNDALRNKVRSSTLICLEDSFPDDGVWQRKQLTPAPTTDREAPQQPLAANEYVDSMLQFSVHPVASSLAFLGADSEQRAIGAIVETVLATLMAYVCERRIKLRWVVVQAAARSSIRSASRARASSRPTSST